MKRNPIIYSDFPDPDIIRVENTYYMASTTMHFMPGCDILRSYNLTDWELIAHAFEKLEDTPGHLLQGENNVYGQGMWAPSLRYHKGTYYITFTANDTHETYLLSSKDPEGPWEKRTIAGFYYDNGLFFDEDDRVYIVHGQKVLHLTEMDEGLHGPKANGLDRVIAEDEENASLGFEGSHLYKREGKYYLFTCHAEHGKKKSQVCFVSDSLTGTFRGKCIIDDDMGFHNLGVAQGGMIDTPQGNWYAFMFQDRGAVGRAPMLMPLHFEKDFPVIGENGQVPSEVDGVNTQSEYSYAPLNGDDDFRYVPDATGQVRLKLFWQFNHTPHADLWSVTERPGAFRLHSGKICKNLVQAYNTLTQRTVGPVCSASVTVDGTNMKEGDFAGLCAFQGCYSALALTRTDSGFKLILQGKPAKDESIFGDYDYTQPAIELAGVSVAQPSVRLKACFDFTDKIDEVRFFYWSNEHWAPLGTPQKLYFKVDHFTGCRAGLFLFSTEETGGTADFIDFRFEKSLEL